MTKVTFKLHPIAVLYLLRSYWYVFTAPIIRIVIQYLLFGAASDFLLTERVLLIATTVCAVFKWYSIKISVIDNEIVIKQGVFIKETINIALSQVLCVAAKQNLFDVVFRSVDCYIDKGSDTSKRMKPLKISVSNFKKLCGNAYNRDFCHCLKIKRKKRRYFTIPTFTIVITVVVGTIIYFFWLKNTYFVYAFVILLMGELYYTCVCYYNYKFDKIAVGNVVFMQGSKGFKLYKLFYDKNKVDKIKITQNPLDLFRQTCKIKVLVHASIGNVLKIKNVSLKEAKLMVNKRDA